MTEAEVRDLTIEILKGIRGELIGMRAEMVEMKGEIVEMKGEMRRGFEELSARIDNVLLGEHQREHSDLRSRVARIEAHLGLSDSR